MFSVQGSGFRVQGSVFSVQGSGFRVQGSGFRVQSPGCRVQGSGFRFQVPGFRVQGSEMRVGHQLVEEGHRDLDQLRCDLPRVGLENVSSTSLYRNGTAIA